MNKTRRRSVCPISCTLDILGDKWSLVLVRDLFAGKTRFNEFAQSPERIASNILADRLERLERHGVIASKPSAQREGSLTYTLTPKGRALYPVLQAIGQWGLTHIRGTEARVQLPAG